MNKKSQMHGGFGECLRLPEQRFVRLCAGRQRLSPDDDHQRHRHWRDAPRLDVEHGRRSAVDEAHQTPERG